ncbi:MAG TPA: phage tail sheath C-terminal domain-containing protein, partial [Longimicrobium sp.]|nr:phage tail sheath C-terminal domain-containing protein [Longimicrobium sp.]
QDILSWEAMNLFPDGPGSPNPERWSIQHQVDTIPTTADPGAVDQALREKIPLLGQMEQWMADDQNVLPPGAAVAGLVTKVDAAEGPWVSPANVALTGVTQPTYPLTDSQQQGLTVPPDGRSVDAIRAFAGRGTVVWGGRTLDGNSNDYRYIQVRRTIIYIEQSIKNALEQFVFAPNDASTWTAVVSMVSAFLQQVWGLGGLVGSRPSEAFTVTCGLGSTMTSQDVLDGSMIVEVSVAVVRPAEFIELTFQQQMQSPS